MGDQHRGLARGLVRADETLIAHAVTIADTEGISMYDVGYVAGARSTGAQQVSCDFATSCAAISP